MQRFTRGLSSPRSRSAFAGGAQRPDKLKLGFVWRSPARSACRKRAAARARCRGSALGNKIGGLAIELVTGDSKTNPGATVRSFRPDREEASLLVGLTGSNELLAG